MNHLIKIALSGLFTLTMAQAGHANESHHVMGEAGTQASKEVQIVNATGVVKLIDLENKKITIVHQPIPAIGWPAMTMRFTFTTQDERIDRLKVGSPVNFSFIQQGNISLLQDITVISS